MARGHRIEGIPEVPLVIDNGMESLTKTKAAVELLKAVGAYADAERAKNSKTLRAGQGVHCFPMIAACAVARV